LCVKTNIILTLLHLLVLLYKLTNVVTSVFEVPHHGLVLLHIPIVLPVVTEFRIPTVVLQKTQIFWDVMLCH